MLTLNKVILLGKSSTLQHSLSLLIEEKVQRKLVILAWSVERT
jgi:hypothetical protein